MHAHVVRLCMSWGGGVQGLHTSDGPRRIRTIVCCGVRDSHCVKYISRISNPKQNLAKSTPRYNNAVHILL